MKILGLNPGTAECAIIWFAASVLAAFSQILMKVSANRKHKNMVREYVNPYLATAYALAVISLFMTNVALTSLDLKFSPVFQAVKYICIWVLGMLLFREHISKRRMLGITVIILGIIVFGA